jgi:hypothetical protein
MNQDFRDSENVNCEEYITINRIMSPRFINLNEEESVSKKIESRINIF